MIAGKSVLALIPARSGSKGLPGKNLRPMLGKPLIAWTIESAAACHEIDATVVTTDDRAIAEVAVRFGATAPFLRPVTLATDSAASIDVVLHALDVLAEAGHSFDIVVLLEPTSPLRDVTDISGALGRLVGTKTVESVVSVARAECAHPAYLYRLNDGLLQPYTGVQPTGIRRQDLETLYFVEGSVYASFVNALRLRRSFYHEHTAPWVVARYKSLEIDELSDFIAVEALLAAHREGRL